MGNSMKTLWCRAWEKKIMKYELFGIKSSSKMYFEFFSVRYVDLVHQYLRWNSIWPKSYLMRKIDFSKVLIQKAGLFSYFPPALLTKLLFPLPPPPTWCSAEQFGSRFCLIKLLQIPVCLLSLASASSQLLGRYLRFVKSVHCLLTRKRRI